jgi:hypothetical protein
MSVYDRLNPTAMEKLRRGRTSAWPPRRRRFGSPRNRCVSALWLELEDVQRRMLHFSPGATAAGGRPGVR